MSKAVVQPINIEWTPTWVRAYNPANGERDEATTIAGLGQIVTNQRQAIVGVGRNHVFLKAIRLPKAAQDDLRRIIGVQLGSLFPLPPDQLSFDFIQTSDLNGDGFLTVVAAIRSDDLLRIRAELKQSALTPVRILPVALASAAVAQRAGLTDALVAESGQAGLALDVVQHGIVRFSRVAPAGADPAVEALRTLAAARAEALPIVNVGDSKFENAHPADDPGLTVLQDAPAFSFELAEERARIVQQAAAKTMRTAVLFVTAAVLLVLLVWSDRQDKEAVVTKAEGSSARILTVNKSILDDASKKAGKVIDAKTTLDRAFEVAQPLSDVSAVIGDSLPKGAWLTALKVERGKPIEIRGTAEDATDVTKLVDTLGENPRFRDVRLVFANSSTIENTPVINFNVTATSVGNLPMPVPVKPGARPTATATTTVQTASSDTSGASSQ